MSEELKPCPFCGGTDIAISVDENQGNKWGSAVCYSCSAVGPEVRTGYETYPEASWRAEAAAEWNRRASPTPHTTEGRENGHLLWRLRHNDTAKHLCGLAADEIERLSALLSSPRVEEVRREALEEAAKVADEAQATAREEIAEEKAEEGYDPYAFGSGFLSGELTAAVNIAKAIRALKEKNNG